MDALAALVASRLKSRFQRVYVFGSRVKGTARDTSDVDVIVVDPGFEGKSTLSRVSEVMGLLWDIVERYGVDIDVVALTPDEFEKKSASRTNIVGYLLSRGEVVEA